jgi:hypothetical protein
VIVCLRECQSSRSGLERRAKISLPLHHEVPYKIKIYHRIYLPINFWINHCGWHICKFFMQQIFRVFPWSNSFQSFLKYFLLLLHAYFQPFLLLVTIWECHLKYCIEKHYALIFLNVSIFKNYTLQQWHYYGSCERLGLMDRCMKIFCTKSLFMEKKLHKGTLICW